MLSVLFPLAYEEDDTIAALDEERSWLNTAAFAESESCSAPHVAPQGHESRVSPRLLERRHDERSTARAVASFVTNFLAVGSATLTVLLSSRLYTQLWFWMPDVEAQLWYVRRSD